MFAGWAGPVLRATVMAAWLLMSGLIIVRVVYYEIIHGNRSLLEMLPILAPLVVGFVAIATVLILQLMRPTEDVEQ